MTLGYLSIGIFPGFRKYPVPVYSRPVMTSENARL